MPTRIERVLYGLVKRGSYVNCESSSAGRARALAAGQLIPKLAGPTPAFHGCLPTVSQYLVLVDGRFGASQLMS